MHNIRGTSTSRQISVSKFIKHPSYCEGDYSHDIALIQIEELLKQNNKVGFSCLPPINDAKYPNERNESVVIGWGKENEIEDNKLSNFLKNVVIKIPKQTDGCENKPFYICAGDVNGGKDSRLYN